MMSTILMTEEPPDLGAVGGWYGKPGLPGMGLDMRSGRFRTKELRFRLETAPTIFIGKRQNQLEPLYRYKPAAFAPPAAPITEKITPK